MQANELRIGNFVIAFYEDANIEVQVCGIYAGVKDRWEISFKDANGWSKYCKLENVKPIPLTEEGLLKFGFYKPFLRFTKVKGGWDYLDQNSLRINEYPIKYVHHFQNLYFALYWKEIEVKTNAPQPLPGQSQLK